MLSLDRGDESIYRLLPAIEPVIIHKLLLVVFHDLDLFAATEINECKRLEI